MLPATGIARGLRAPSLGYRGARSRSRPSEPPPEGQGSMAQMRYRVLGSSGLRVSEISLGTMMFGGPTDEAEARRIVDHAAEAGVNFIDTANVYSDGRSEAVVGPA